MEKINITEEEINHEIEYDFDIKEDVNEKTSRFAEYTLDYRGWDKEIETKEINMNPYSLSFFIKSLFCKNSNAIYMSTFINFFQDLNISTLTKPNFYSTCSHAATLYILKMLEKNDVVKIVEYTSQNTETYKSSTNVETKLKMYDVLFYKLRDLNKSDRGLIEEIEKTLRISKRQIRFRFQSGELHTKLGIIQSLGCIFTGYIFTQFKKNLTYWKNADGFKNDLTNFIYSLKRSNKPTLK